MVCYHRKRYAISNNEQTLWFNRLTGISIFLT